ncbi:MAG: hypothetical protein IAI49_06805 [Candidatus Eremiobacteraeota bacterium]|nr:hypothetical protein [Candidatus Eremiobacteraeota bacterium]
MNDDLEFLRARLPGYRGYGEEAERHDSDMRVRAFVGKELTDARSRLGETVEAAQTTFDAVLLRCMFTDQVFVKKFEHADLDAAMLAGLVRADRTLVELGGRLAECAAAGLPAILAEINVQLDYRRSPAPLATS